jgi:hypothetical protein
MDSGIIPLCQASRAVGTRNTGDSRIYRKANKKQMIWWTIARDLLADTKRSNLRVSNRMTNHIVWPIRHDTGETMTVKRKPQSGDVKHRIIHVRELPMLYVGLDSQGLGLSQSLTWFVD